MQNLDYSRSPLKLRKQCFLEFRPIFRELQENWTTLILCRYFSWNIAHTLTQEGREGCFFVSLFFSFESFPHYPPSPPLLIQKQYFTDWPGLCFVVIRQQS